MGKYTIAAPLRNTVHTAGSGDYHRTSAPSGDSQFDGTCAPAGHLTLLCCKCPCNHEAGQGGTLQLAQHPSPLVREPELSASGRSSAQRASEQCEEARQGELAMPPELRCVVGLTASSVLDVTGNLAAEETWMQLSKVQISVARPLLSLVKMVYNALTGSVNARCSAIRPVGTVVTNNANPLTGATRLPK